jgi:hypothetical protein
MNAMTPSAPSPLSPIVKVLTVKATPDRAFRRFTEEMASGWPLRTHSAGGEAAETVVMEGRVGGRIVERIRGGRPCVWGTVTAWEPPRRVAFTWHPGRDSATAHHPAPAGPPGPRLKPGRWRSASDPD